VLIEQNVFAKTAVLTPMLCPYHSNIHWWTAYCWPISMNH